MRRALKLRFFFSAVSFSFVFFEGNYVQCQKVFNFWLLLFLWVYTGRQNGIYLLLIKISESITSEWCKSFPIPTLVKQSVLSLLSKIPFAEIFSSVTFRKKQTQNFTKQIKVSHKSKFLSWTLFKKKNDEKSQF